MEKTKKYLVSVIIAAYNIEKYISKCLDSIINQTYTKIEIIVVNDCSLDSSGKIAEGYAKKDSRVTVVNHQKNQGLSAARNTGLDNSKGDFVTFIDGDDFLSEDFVEYFLSIFEITGADLCISMNNFTTKDSTQIVNDKIVTITSSETVAELLYPRIRMGVWNKLWRRDFIIKNKIRFIHGQPTAEGLTFMTNAAQYVNYSGVGQRKVYYYRLNNENSATTKANVEKQGLGSLQAMDIIEQNLDLTSSNIRYAMNYQRWNTSTYALRQIIDAEAEIEYQELFENLINYIRKNSLKMLLPNFKLPLRMRLIAVCRFINPVLITKVSLYFRDRHLKKDYM